MRNAKTFFRWRPLFVAYLNVYVEDESGSARLVVSASDWINIDAYKFLKRILVLNPNMHLEGAAQTIQTLGDSLRLLITGSGDVVGRACIIPHRIFHNWINYYRENDGIITVGGLRSAPLQHIAGVLVGAPTRASRDAAIPFVEPDRLAAWASEQAEIIHRSYGDPQTQAECAEIILECGGDAGHLAYALSSRGWLSLQDVAEWKGIPNEVLVIQDDDFWYDLKTYRNLKLKENVLIIPAGGILLLRENSYINGAYWHDFSERIDNDTSDHFTVSAIVQALASAWASSSKSIQETSEPNTFQEVALNGRKSLRAHVDIYRKPHIDHISYE